MRRSPRLRTNERETVAPSPMYMYSQRRGPLVNEHHIRRIEETRTPGTDAVANRWREQRMLYRKGLKRDAANSLWFAQREDAAIIHSTALAVSATFLPARNGHGAPSFRPQA